MWTASHSKPTSTARPIRMQRLVVAAVTIILPLAAHFAAGHSYGQQADSRASRRPRLARPPIRPTSDLSSRQAPIPKQIAGLPTVRAELEVVRHRSRLIVAHSRIKRSSVADSAIAQVVQYSPEEIAVIGMSAGSTNLTLWFEDESDPLIYLVKVFEDPLLEQPRNVDYAALERKLSVLFPNSQVALVPLSGRVIVKGEVPNLQVAQSILQIIREETARRPGPHSAPAEPYRTTGMAVMRTELELVNLLQVRSDAHVKLYVKVVEIDRSLLRQMGLDLHGIVNTRRRSVPFGPGGSSGALTGLFERAEIDALLSQLASYGALKGFSEPTLTVLSGHSAGFLSGGEFALPTSIGSSGVAETVPGFGTSLIVVPTVMGGDRVRLRLMPEFQDNNSVSLNGASTPAQRLETTVELRQGQTVALTGLVRKHLNAHVRRRPFLGNIPLVGSDFNETFWTQSETELLILVSPEVFSQPSNSSAQTGGPAVAQHSRGSLQLQLQHNPRLPTGDLTRSLAAGQSVAQQVITRVSGNTAAQPRSLAPAQPRPNMNQLNLQTLRARPHPPRVTPKQAAAGAAPILFRPPSTADGTQGQRRGIQRPRPAQSRIQSTTEQSAPAKVSAPAAASPNASVSVEIEKDEPAIEATPAPEVSTVVESATPAVETESDEAVDTPDLTAAEELDAHTDLDADTEPITDAELAAIADLDAQAELGTQAELEAHAARVAPPEQTATVSESEVLPQHSPVPPTETVAADVRHRVSDPRVKGTIPNLDLDPLMQTSHTTIHTSMPRQPLRRGQPPLQNAIPAASHQYRQPPAPMIHNGIPQQRQLAPGMSAHHYPPPVRQQVGPQQPIPHAQRRTSRTLNQRPPAQAPPVRPPQRQSGPAHNPPSDMARQHAAQVQRSFTAPQQVIGRTHQRPASAAPYQHPAANPTLQQRSLHTAPRQGSVVAPQPRPTVPGAVQTHNASAIRQHAAAQRQAIPQRNQRPVSTAPIQQPHSRITVPQPPMTRHAPPQTRPTIPAQQRYAQQAPNGAFQPRPTFPPAGMPRQRVQTNPQLNPQFMQQRHAAIPGRMPIARQPQSYQPGSAPHIGPQMPYPQIGRPARSAHYPAPVMPGQTGPLTGLPRSPIGPGIETLERQVSDQLAPARVESQQHLMGTTIQGPEFSEPMVAPPLDADVVTAGPVLMGPDAPAEQKTVSTSLTTEIESAAPTPPKPFKGPQLMWNDDSTTIETQEVPPAQPIEVDVAEDDALPLIVPGPSRRSKSE